MTTTIEARPPTTDRSLPVIGAVADPELLEDAHHLSEALSDLIRVVQFRDRDRACCYELSVSQCYALKAVDDTGPLTVNELAAQLYLDKSTASRLANGLVDKGHLVRERDADDGRVVRLAATEEGHALCSQIEGDLAMEYAELLSDFDPEIRAAITRVVSRLGRSFAARVDASGGSCCVVK